MVKRKKPRITVKNFVDASGSYSKISKLSEKNTRYYGWMNTKEKLAKAFKKI